MTPSARLQAVVELLEAFGASGLPLDVLAGNYFRKRRYIGAKDRRAVKETLYQIVRRYLPLKWKLQGAGAEATPRLLLLAFLAEAGNLDDIGKDGGKYGLPPPDAGEKKVLAALGGENPPAWVDANCPEWLEAGFKERFGDAYEKEMRALDGRAPLTLRANTLKISVEKAAPVLEERGFVKTKLSPVGFSSPGNMPLHHLPGFKDGHYEVQDEGAQVAAGLVSAEPGEQVLDLCAGAGGKTLALAALMENKGQIFAYDTDEKRLKTLKTRVQKAGVRNVQVVEKGGLKALSGKMDRVLIDVPCSGTGTWRRSPDLRIRLTPGKLDQYLKTQTSLLAEGAGYAKPGGLLVYVTCSLLPAENEAQVDAFLKSHPGWALQAIACDDNAAALTGALQLTPARHGADGFFVARLHKPVTKPK